MKTSGKQSGLEELHTIQVSVFQNETVKLSFRKVSLYRCQKLCRSRTARTSVLIAAFHLLQSRCCRKTGSESPDVSIYPWELEES